MRYDMINADDIYIFGDSAKDLYRVMRGIIKRAETAGLTIKPEWKLIDCGGSEQQPYSCGYSVQRRGISRHISMLQAPERTADTGAGRDNHRRRINLFTGGNPRGIIK